MLSKFSYPIICTENFVQTVAFYEDYFEYVPAFEMDGFVILKRATREDMYLAVIDATHSVIPEAYRGGVKGMILSFPVIDARLAYQEMYWEGLKIVSEPSNALCGRRHFFVEDPNGILIDVAEDLDLEALMDAEKIKELCVVS